MTTKPIRVGGDFGNSWPRRIIDVYRLGDGRLAHVATLTEGDTPTSPLLPGMDMPLARIFVGLPTEEAPEL